MRLITALLFIPAFSFSQKDTVAERFSKLVNKADLEKHLKIIASDEYEGRATGEKGQKMAADYIAAHFKNSGIPSRPGGTYFQSFPLKLKDPKKITVKAGEHILRLPDDYYFFPFMLPVGLTTSNEAAFAGFGISEKKYDDYKNLDVKGKMVIVLNGEPAGKKGKFLLSGNSVSSDWTDYKRKAEHAKNLGAAGLFVIVDRKMADRFSHYLTSTKLEPYKEEEKKENDEKSNFPIIFIYEQTADKILGVSSSNLKKEIEKKGEPNSFVKKIELTVDARKYAEKVTGENVLGFVEGSDLKDEVIIITAHYDHIGKEGKEVYNGADDDGSGTVAVMELAEAFASAKSEGKGPRRSILFMPVSGEEKGLLGSEYYVKNPVFPLASTVCNLNIDMIGRTDTTYKAGDEYVYLIGSDILSKELHKVSENANNTYTKLKLDYRYNNLTDKNRFYYRSDHYNFAKNNIPVIFYFNGTHEDYHQPTDEADKINFDLLEKRARLIFFTAWELANREERIKADIKEKK